jgi:hypothetical protein
MRYKQKASEPFLVRLLEENKNSPGDFNQNRLIAARLNLIVAPATHLLPMPAHLPGDSSRRVSWSGSITRYGPEMHGAVELAALVIVHLNKILEP